MSTPVTSLFFFKPIIGGGGCLRGSGRTGRAGARRPPRSPQASAVLMAWAVRQRDSGGALERGSTVLRAADAHLHRVRRMPSRPQRQAVGASFDCDLLKHGQHKPRPSKGWSVGPLMLVGLPRISGPMRVPSGFDGRGCLSPLVACDAELVACGGRSVGNPDFGAAGDGLHPRPSAPGGTHTGRVWSSSSSVARDPEISSTWLAKCRQSGMQGPARGAGVFAPRFPTRASSRIFVPTGACLGVLAAVRAAATLECVVGRRGVGLSARHCVRNGRRQHPPQAASVVGPSALLPWPRSVSCAAYPSRRHSIVPNVPFSPCAAPLGAAARGGPQGARCVPRPRTAARARVVGPLRRRPISRMRNTRWVRGLGLCFAPKASVRRFVRTTPATVLGSSHGGPAGVGEECYLVDPASSHMLVSKIKPCMLILELNTCNKPRLLEGMHLLDKRSTRAPPVAAMIHDNSTDRTALVPATHHSNFCPINFRWVRFRRGSLRNGYHIQGRQQARKLPNPDTGRIHWRASLVPAAAVIPAPIAWTLGWAGRSASGVHRSSRPFCRRCAPGLNWPGRASGAVTLKKLECSKQAYALYTLAWDNIIGFRSYYVGLRDRTFAKDVFINQERKLGARRRSDTVLVSTINDADQGSADVAFRTPPAPYEKSKSLGSGGSMVARLKLKGIDGRAPPGVEPAA
ncbi:UNVERIFIED_CONTAM: hypothetical protein Sindi_3001000 [Sesamum indicum]